MTNVRKIPTLSQQANPQQPFDISAAVLKCCERCGGDYFDAALKIGTISALSPNNRTGQDIVLRFDVFLCRGCGHEFGTPVKSETRQ